MLVRRYITSLSTSRTYIPTFRLYARIKLFI